MIVDDPGYDPLSDVMREWLEIRCKDLNDAAPVIVMSRLHERDDAGHILQDFPKHPLIEKIEMQRMVRMLDDAERMQSFPMKEWVK